MIQIPQPSPGRQRRVYPNNLSDQERALVVIIQRNGEWVDLGEHPRLGAMSSWLRRRGAELATRNGHLYARWAHGKVHL